MDGEGVLCRGRCGFYGSSLTDRYCSLCYKEQLRENPQLQSLNVASSSASSNPKDGTKQTYALDSPQNYNANDSDAVDPSSLNFNFGDVRRNLNDIFDEELSNDEDNKDIGASNARNKSENVASSTTKKNKCHVCKKRVGLTGFDCRCGGVFCGLHRYSDNHGCTFDYVAQAQKEMAEKNPKIVKEKIDKI